VDEWTILHSFYNGLSYMYKSVLDFAVGGAFMTKTISEAKAILENMLQNHWQWRPTPLLEKSTLLKKYRV
jgi:hypothetical protein